jgi:23S rRNA pseudouridine1911/1915/1917 synthase
VADEEIRRLVAESDGERLDAFLAAHLEDISRSRAAQLISDGHVTINERVPKKSEKVSAGDIVLVTVPAAEPSTVTPEDIPSASYFRTRTWLSSTNRRVSLCIRLWVMPGVRS